MITLPIKKKWFDMILLGEKKEEYREMKNYYHSRFENIGLLNHVLEPKNTTRWVKFRNGYSRKSPSFYAKVKIRMGEGKPEWGAEAGKDYWILEILEIKKAEDEKERILKYADKDTAYFANQEVLQPLV